MWTAEIITGMKSIFDIRSILLALVPLCIYLAGSIISYKLTGGKNKVWAPIVALINIGYAIFLGRKVAFIIAMDTFMVVFAWTIWTLYHALPFEIKNPIRAWIGDTIFFIAILSFSAIIATGPSRYNRNIVELEPETESTFYCLTTNEYVSSELIPEGGMSLSSLKQYICEDQTNMIRMQLIVVDGEMDYIERIENDYYKEDRNVEPAVRSYSRTETSYILYVGKDKK